MLCAFIDNCNDMEFGSNLVYAPKDGSKQEYEHVPESRYNHVVKAYSSGASASYDPHDDGQVPFNNMIQHIIILFDDSIINFHSDLSAGHLGHCRPGGILSNERSGTEPGSW